MFTNKNNSTIKNIVDNWYKANMTEYTTMLEDTVWCNDRTLTSGSLYSKDADGLYASLFAAYSRNQNTFKPSIVCSNLRDSFTVDSTNGNGKLTYPVGLLTADEYTMAGSGRNGYSTSAYLHIGLNQWSLSPARFTDYRTRGYYLNDVGQLDNNTITSTRRSVRPSVSLKSETCVTSGDGSVTNPYIVE